MSTPRKGQSRPATGRPRKIAGRGAEPGEAIIDERASASDVEPEGAVVDERASASDVEPPPVVEEGAPAPVSKPPRRRTTWILVAVIAALVVALAAEVFVMVYYRVIDDDPTVSAARPVVTGELSHRAAVEAAARSTEQILSTTYQDYDSQVAQASEKMTDTFAKEYQGTSDGIKDDFIAQKTKLQVKAVAQGVVQASSAQVQALLFLNQYVEKEQDGKPATSFAQYRALVTVVHTDHGWLVSDIKTQ